MALIQEMIRAGQKDRAQALVRNSPDGVPVPPEYVVRIHTLMTKGAAGLGDLEPLEGFSELVKDDTEDHAEEGKKDESGPVREPVPESTAAAEPVSGAAFIPEERTSTRAGGLATASETPGATGGSVGGRGAGALVEEVQVEKEIEKPAAAIPRIDRELAAIKWENYSGKLKLTKGEIPVSVGARPQGGDRISAMSLAILVHVVVAIVISLVVVSVPRPNPPKLVLTMPETTDSDELVVKKLTRRQEIKPSAASRQMVNVVTSVHFSDVSLPDVENTTALDVTAMFDGAAELGLGMSLSPDTHSQSDVNFFGISSGGDEIVFVVDATRSMLVDEKGGMFAYDKVKKEIASMLINLNRGTKFNILLYEGGKVVAFRDELVPGLPSNIRLAIEWMDPLNRDYDNLGLTRHYGEPIRVADVEGLPITARDVEHYTKCIQKAMEWQAAAIFCISSGYRVMDRSMTPEMVKKLMESRVPGKVDPRDQERWNRAVEKTREWLRKENEARRKKGLAPKVVTNFRQLVIEKTGVRPPQPQGGSSGGFRRPPDVTKEDIDEQLKRLVRHYYKDQDKDDPSVHMVVFLGEEEEFRDQDEDHFRRIVRRNHGKLKMLRGLAALQDVTGAE